MTTVRQLERQWDARRFNQLFAELIAARPEAALTPTRDDAHIAAAAMAVIRLDELNQSHAPLARKLLRALLAAQQPDGGWGDPMITALAIRALSCSNGQGVAIDRAMDYLANLQQPQGSWPRIPFRRMPADALVTAYIMLSLGNLPQFRGRIRVTDACAWFANNVSSLDREARRIWQRAELICRLAKQPERMQSPQLWS